MLGPRTTARVFARVPARSFNTSYGAWIDGKDYMPASATTFDVEDPARRTHLASILDSDAATVDKAVESARASFASGVWSRMDVRDRAEILHESARALRKQVPTYAANESIQTGRAIREMNAQLGRLPE